MIPSIRRWGFLLLISAGMNANVWANAPKLVVIVMGDQIRADYLERYRAYLAPDGLRRFLEQGAYFTNASHDDAVTKTSPGHVLVGSGLYPNQSGIIGNEWFDEASDKMVSPAKTVKGGERVQLKWFAGKSFAQRLHEKKPRSRVVSVSLKDRAALLLTGPDQDDAYWWDREQKMFVNYKSPPTWLAQFNEGVDAFVRQHRKWNALISPTPELRDAFERQSALTKGHVRDNHRLGVSFPHPVKSLHALMMSPFSDELVEELAERITQEWDLGNNPGKETDVLTVSFSAVDIVGHEFGPDSEEVMDAFLNLDSSVATLMKFVDERVGKDVVWVFSSDHGVTPFPEVSKANGFQAGRVHIDSAILSQWAPIRAISLPYIYADDSSVSILREKLRTIDGVQAVYSSQEIGQGLVPKEITKSFYAKRSGELFVVLKPNYIFSEADDCGTTHGEPTWDDQHVPLGFYGFHIAAKIRDTPTSVSVVAPTLLKLLGIPAADLAVPVEVGVQ